MMCRIPAMRLNEKKFKTKMSNNHSNAKKFQSFQRLLEELKNTTKIDQNSTNKRPVEVVSKLPIKK